MNLLEELKSKIYIKAEDTCFDYVDSIECIKGIHYITVFVEPVGNVTLKTKKSDINEIAYLVSNVFNHQPSDLTYAVAGHRLYRNLTNSLTPVFLELMDFDEIWSDYFVWLEESVAFCADEDGRVIPNSVGDLYILNQLNKEDESIYVRIGENLYNDLNDAFIAKLIHMKYIGYQKFLCIFDVKAAKELNDILGIDVSNVMNNVFEVILSDDYYLIDDYMKVIFGIATMAAIKKEYNEYKENHQDLLYDEYLDWVRKKEEKVFASYKKHIIETVVHLANHIDKEYLTEKIDETNFEIDYLSYPEDYEFIEPESFMDIYFGQDWKESFGKDDEIV